MYTLRRLNAQHVSTSYHILNDRKAIAILTNARSHAPRNIINDNEKVSGFELIRLNDHEKLHDLWTGAVVSPQQILDQINENGTDLLAVQKRAQVVRLQFRTLFGLTIYQTQGANDGGWEYFTGNRNEATKLTLQEAQTRLKWEKPQGNMSITGDMIVRVEIADIANGSVLDAYLYKPSPVRYKDEADFEVIKASPSMTKVFRETFEERLAGGTYENPYRETSDQFTAYEFAWLPYAASYNEALIEAQI
ncbi:hypothetical protein RYA05_01860 [Pseudomonas syringae pv. actinidiae]|nr:hypothetical protein [Pseudomonas syringae pv. actinidiae]